MNHVAWGKQATYISWHEPFRWQKCTVCSLTIKTRNSLIPFCYFMLSPDSLPGCHRDARFEPIKGQAPAAPAPSNKYALPCALQCPWDRFFTFHFLRFEPSPMTPMYFTAAWFPSDGCSLQSLFQSALIGKLVDHKMMGLAFFLSNYQDLLGPVALMAAMDRASVMRLIRCLLQWKVPEEACLTWWPTWYQHSNTVIIYTI